MISYLKGQIIDLDFLELTILTNSGVGYEVLINELIYSKLESSPPTPLLKGEGSNNEVGLYIYHHRTENSQSLFGFVDKDEKTIFKELIKISGVGGKVAMQLLSMGKERLVESIVNGDDKTIQGIKGIGKKMSEKIVLELKDKDFAVSIDSNSSTPANKNNSQLHSSIKETLVNMGYNPGLIDKELSTLPDDIKDAGEIIPYVIKNL